MGLQESCSLKPLPPDLCRKPVLPLCSPNFNTMPARALGSYCSALWMELWDVIRCKLFFHCSEIISGGKTPGWPWVVINFMCLGCSHHSEKRLRAGMIDDGQEGDGPWNCSTSSVPLITGRSSAITFLHLPLNKQSSPRFLQSPLLQAVWGPQ